MSGPSFPSDTSPTNSARNKLPVAKTSKKQSPIKATTDPAPKAARVPRPLPIPPGGKTPGASRTQPSGSAGKTTEKTDEVSRELLKITNEIEREIKELKNLTPTQTSGEKANQLVNSLNRAISRLDARIEAIDSQIDKCNEIEQELSLLKEKNTLLMSRNKATNTIAIYSAEKQIAALKAMSKVELRGNQGSSSYNCLKAAMTTIDHQLEVISRTLDAIENREGNSSIQDDKLIAILREENSLLKCKKGIIEAIAFYEQSLTPRALPLPPLAVTIQTAPQHLTPAARRLAGRAHYKATPASPPPRPARAEKTQNEQSSRTGLAASKRFSATALPHFTTITAPPEYKTKQVDQEIKSLVKLINSLKENQKIVLSNTENDTSKLVAVKKESKLLTRLHLSREGTSEAAQNTTEKMIYLLEKQLNSVNETPLSNSSLAQMHQITDFLQTDKRAQVVLRRNPELATRLYDILYNEKMAPTKAQGNNSLINLYAAAHQIKLKNIHGGTLIEQDGKVVLITNKKAAILKSSEENFKKTITTICELARENKNQPYIHSNALKTLIDYLDSDTTISAIARTDNVLNNSYNLAIAIVASTRPPIDPTIDPVEKLLETVLDQTENQNRNALLHTYRWRLTTKEVITNMHTVLKKNSSPETWDAAYDFCKRWCTNDDVHRHNPEECQIMLAFLQSIKSSDSNRWNELATILEKLLKTTPSEQSTNLSSQQLPAISKEDFTKALLNPKEQKKLGAAFRDQITSQTLFHLSRLSPAEFEGLAWSKNDKHTRAPNLLAIIAHFNQTSSFVADTLVSCATLNESTQAFSFFINQAELFVEEGNFDAAQSILAGLNNAAVYRLPIELDSTNRDKLSKLTALFSYEKSFSALRATYKVYESENRNYIPYLGMYLTDLTFIDEGNPKNPENPMKTHTASLFYSAQMGILQAKKYHLHKRAEPATQNVLSLVKRATTDDQALSEKSLKLYPRTNRSQTQ